MFKQRLDQPKITQDMCLRLLFPLNLLIFFARFGQYVIFATHSQTNDNVTKTSHIFKISGAKLTMDLKYRSQVNPEYVSRQIYRLYLNYKWGLNDFSKTLEKQAKKLNLFIYSEKATKLCKIFTLFLTGTTQDTSKVKISQNFVAFSEL